MKIFFSASIIVDSTVLLKKILRHFDKFKKVVFKIDSIDYVNKKILS